jgi:hypothetical protein
VRIKLGIKVLSILSSMAMSLVVIAGCNEDSAPSGAAPGAGGPPPGVKKPGELNKPMPPAAPPGGGAEKPAETPKTK